MKIIIIATLSLAFAAPASAGVVVAGQSTNLFNAGATCLPALPRFDEAVRKRPLALANEGSAASFVTCNYTVDERALRSKGGVERFDIIAKNQGSRAEMVTCTAVVGVDDGRASYLVQSVSLRPGERNAMEWVATDYGFANGWEGPVNMSCLLPAGTALNEGHVHWDYADDT